jgi:hypothetical protein
LLYKKDLHDEEVKFIYNWYYINFITFYYLNK